jgi:prevent-host-death family protein
MKKTNALELRQNMGKVVKELLRTGEPILIEKSRKPVAVLITLEDYHRRFVDRDADEKRRELVERIRAAKIKLPEGKSSLDLVRETRS